MLKKGLKRNKDIDDFITKAKQDTNPILAHEAVIN